MSNLADTLTKLWPSFSIPGARTHPQTFSTYSGFRFEDLPSVNADADDQFSWLMGEPEKEEWSLQDEDGDVEIKLQSIEAESELALPTSIVTFLRSPGLQSCVRSCTACYLQLPDYLVPVSGSGNGYLLHFLSDQQWCLHWSLYFDQSGEEFVICSETAYGFEDEEEQPFSKSSPVDLAKEGIVICAPSFTEFIYRFWIENEIWYNAKDGVPMDARQQAYLEQYKGEQS